MKGFPRTFPTEVCASLRHTNGSRMDSPQPAHCLQMLYCMGCSCNRTCHICERDDHAHKWLASTFPVGKDCEATMAIAIALNRNACLLAIGKAAEWGCPCSSSRKRFLQRLESGGGVISRACRIFGRHNLRLGCSKIHCNARKVKY